MRQASGVKSGSVTAIVCNSKPSTQRLSTLRPKSDYERRCHLSFRRRRVRQGRAGARGRRAASGGRAGWASARRRGRRGRGDARSGSRARRGHGDGRRSAGAGRVPAGDLPEGARRVCAASCGRAPCCSRNDTYSQEVAPRLAHRLGGSAVGDGVEVRVEGGAVARQRQVYGGKAQAVIELKRAPAVVWLRARSFAPAAPRAEARRGDARRARRSDGHAHAHRRAQARGRRRGAARRGARHRLGRARHRRAWSLSRRS